MKFSVVIGKNKEALKKEPQLIEKAEQRLSTIIMELATSYTNKTVGTKLGGDVFIFNLVAPIKQIATFNIPTAATDGVRYYWNPNFIMKHHKVGLRLVVAHEAFHAIFMHPQRRGSRNPKLWNIAVDYIVNGLLIMEDLQTRGFNPKDMFEKYLGKFMTLEEYVNLLKDPFKKQNGFEDLDVEAEAGNQNNPVVNLPKPDEDRELTPEEIEELEKREKKEKFFFADPNLPVDMRRPEAIYEYLLSLLPKCPKCGRIGVYKLPNKNKGKKDKKKDKKSDQDESEDKDQQNQTHDHGDGSPCDCPNHQGDQQGKGEGEGEDNDQDGQGQGNSCNHGGKDGCGHCDECGDGVDIFGLGGTLDDHMDTQESEEKLAKRMSDAVEATRKMAGTVPAGLEDELGKLTAPKITWQDIIRSRLKKAHAGNQRNDYTRFKTRPMFAGVLTPKRRSFFTNFVCLLDTSGSMSKDDMAFGVSQLAGLDEKAEGTMVYGDCSIYWDKQVKLKKCNVEELSKLKPVGRGGTMYSSFFTDYEKNVGKCDFLVIISDMYLLDEDVAQMRDPGIDVYWICTSGNTTFRPPFGKLLMLHNER